METFRLEHSGIALNSSSQHVVRVPLVVRKKTALETRLNAKAGNSLAKVKVEFRKFFLQN